MRTHAGQLNYRCDLCPKIFNTHQDVVMHQTVHIGNKPFVCACGYSFRQQDRLARHIKEDHNQFWQFSAPDVIFKRKLISAIYKAGLKRELPHVCNACGKRFANNEACQKHEIEKHRAFHDENKEIQIADSFLS